jgi:tetratricopeptide (TPR) repeat protein
MSGTRLSTREWFERARAALLAADIGWTTMCLGGYMPGTKAVMIVLTAALLAVHLLDPSQRARPHTAGWLFLPFLVYAAANLAWVSPDRWIGWFDVLNWAQMIAVFWVVLNGVKSPGCRRFLCVFLAALGVVSCGLSCYEHFVNPHWLMLGRIQHDQFLGRATGPFGIPNSMGVFMAMLIPPVAAFVFRKGSSAGLRILSGIALCALVTGFVLAISRGAWIALAGALVIRALLTPGLSVARRIGIAFAILCGAVAIVAFLYFSYPLMRERSIEFVQDVGERTRPIVWRGAWKIFAAHPVVGGGAGCFDVLFEAYRPEGFRDEPIFAHDDYLNTLADYGVIGFVFFFGPMAYLGFRGARARGLAAAAWTGLLAFSLHLFVDFHLKIPALAMVFSLIAALVVQEAWPGLPEPADKSSVRSRVSLAASWCAAAALLAFTILCVVPKYRAEKFRWAARELIDKMAASGVEAGSQGDVLAKALDGFNRAISLDPLDGQAWSDRAYVDSLLAHVHPDQTRQYGESAFADANRAVGLCPVFAEFWVRRGTGLDMQGRWFDGGNDFVRALQIAPMRADIWYYEAYHLSLKRTEYGPAMADADFCLRLDPGFLLAQVLRQRLVLRLQQRL